MDFKKIIKEREQLIDKRVNWLLFGYLVFSVLFIVLVVKFIPLYSIAGLNEAMEEVFNGALPNLYPALYYSGLILLLSFPLIRGLIKITSYLERNWLKPYVIEDCGDVIKLHGSVGLTNMTSAIDELRSIRDGYKLVIDGAYEKYGCTMAAVKPTEK